MQKKNKFYKEWYTQKQYHDIRFLGISKKDKKRNQKGMFSSKNIESFITVVVLSSRGLDLFIKVR